MLAYHASAAAAPTRARIEPTVIAANLHNFPPMLNGDRRLSPTFHDCDVLIDDALRPASSMSKLERLRVSSSHKR